MAIVLVILLRLFLKKAPKIISYALWGVVLFRLLCPVSIGSGFSLYNLFDAPTEEPGTLTSVIEYVPADIVHRSYPAVVLPVPGASDVINEALPQGQEKLAADPLEAPMSFATYIWMAGVLAMVSYSAVSYIRLRRKLKIVVPLRDNIFIADDIKSPFVVGLFRPKIYLPCNLGEKEQEYIILHEQHHIKRLDHIAKVLAFIALAIHWFNPLVWVAFALAGKDMEMSCDEVVIRKAGGDVRADYSASLLTLATGRRIIAGTSLAFGEGDTRGRIRNLADWRKPAFGAVMVAVIACAALGIGLLTNPADSGEPDRSFLNYKNAVNLVIEQDEIMAIYCPTEDGSSSQIRIGAADGKELAKYLDQWEWKKCKAPKDTLSSPGSVEFVIDSEYHITVYQKKSGALRQYALVSFQDDVQCYSITRNDYADAAALVHAPAKSAEGVDGPEQIIASRKLTVDDVLLLSKKGQDLTWSDFEDYSYIETGFGLYIRLYEIDEQFHLAIGGVPDETPMYICLGVNSDDANARIDIRNGGVGEFIAADHSAVLLSSAINDAILEHFKSSDPDGLLHCASFVSLAQEELCIDGEPAGSMQVTVYGMALHDKYGFAGAGFQVVDSRYHPVKLTFEKTQQGAFRLAVAWFPEFPAKSWEQHADAIYEQFGMYSEDLANSVFLSFWMKIILSGSNRIATIRPCATAEWIRIMLRNSSLRRSKLQL